MDGHHLHSVMPGDDPGSRVVQAIDAVET